MTRGRRGFTLIEVMITLVILFLVIEALSTFFLGTLRQYKQQSKIAESGVQSIVGLEILRRDLEHAGFGLPWNNIPAYLEAVAAPASTLNDAPSSAPRALASLDESQLNGSDYLVIKSTAVGTDAACRKWTTLRQGNVKRTWSDAADNLLPGEGVIVLAPGSADTNWRSLVTAGGAFATTFGGTGAFAPPDAATTYLVYGISSSGTVRFPFNRADYYIDNTSVPSACAPGTGVLVKRVLEHGTGALGPSLPLLDCVADMEAFFLLDTDGDGAIDNTTSSLAGLSAQQVRDQVRQVALFILAHEGQRDPSYVHAQPTFFVGDAGTGIGESFDLAAAVPDYTHYRWKLYTLVVSPQAMRF